MRAVDQWAALEDELEPGWDAVRLAFTVEDEGSAGDAATALAPLAPGRTGLVLRFEVPSSGAGPAKLLNLLANLDRKRIWGTLELLEADRARPPADDPASRPAALGLAEGWDAAVATLPPGWRDVLAELELDSSDHLPRAALLGAPLNPSRDPSATALRFRASSGGGYGTAAGMVRRALERMDEEGIAGRVRVLDALSDTENVGTQGPVWRIAGRSV